MLFFKVEAKHNMTLNEDKAVRHNQLSDIAAAFKNTTASTMKHIISFPNLPKKMLSQDLFSMWMKR